MAARWLSLLLLGLVGGGGVLHVHGQVANLGFISIDCGLPESASGYIDNATKISYALDAVFTDAGTNHNLSAEYMSASMGKSWYTVRSFTSAAGEGNCYKLRSLVVGLKYLIRAKFKYGNYDGLNWPPIFDLHVGINYWQTVNTSDANTAEIYEIITVVPGDSVQVCLVNTGAGTPFISSLDLRPLKNKLYPQADGSQGLVLVARANFGAGDTTLVRYPDDPHDRIWMPYNKPKWSVISTTRNVQNADKDVFEAPSAVMQTAITPINSSSPIDFTWDAQSSTNDPVPGYVCILYIAELQRLPNNDTRQFYVTLNGKLWYADTHGAYTPQYLYTNAIYNPKPDYASHQYNISLDVTANSTLPPIINAAEIYSVIPTTGIATGAQEIAAISAIRDKYHLKKNWMGDPCVPNNFAWKGLRCSYAVSSPPIITGLRVIFL